jgi:hypothetical protein
MVLKNVVVVSVACAIVCGGVSLMMAEETKNPLFSKESIGEKAQVVKDKVKDIDVAAVQQKAEAAKGQAVVGLQKGSVQAKKSGVDLKKKGKIKTGSGLEKAGNKMETGAALLEKTGGKK